MYFNVVQGVYKIQWYTIEYRKPNMYAKVYNIILQYVNIN